MRRKKAIKHGRAIPVLLAAAAGYLIGSWHTGAVRGKEPSGTHTAAETIALRFPRALSEAPVVQAVGYQPTPAHDSAANNAQLALFEPEPMLPSSGSLAMTQSVAAAPAATPPADSQTAERPGTEQTADLASVEPVLSTEAAIAPKPKNIISAIKARAVLVHHQAKRPGYFLDEAQIADIKRRLHLTPDQEQMWPAVAAALRSIGEQKEREARLRGMAGTIDPNSAQVQDLKSAAIPLLMSFSDDQKDEVRDLARNMGLNQLASEF
jgi:hypothetical protein